jgi:hypothetical protein
MKLLMVLGIFYTSLALAQAPEMRLFYVIKKGDWAANVLRDLGLKPLFGQGQIVQKVIKENPHCAPNECNIVRPRDLLYFPSEYSEHIHQHAKVLPSGEVILIGEETVIEPVKTISAPEEAPFQAHSFQRLRISLMYLEFLGEDSNSNSKATTSALAAPKLSYLYKNHFHSKWAYSLGGEASYIGLVRAPNALIQDRFHILGHVFVGGNYFFSPALWAQLQTGLAERILVKGISSSIVEMDQSYVPEIGLGLSYLALENSDYKLIASLEYRQFLPASLRGSDSDGGYGYGAELEYMRNFFNCDLGTFISFENHRIEFPTVDNEYQEYSGGIGYYF